MSALDKRIAADANVVGKTVKGIYCEERLVFMSFTDGTFIQITVFNDADDCACISTDGETDIDCAYLRDLITKDEFIAHKRIETYSLMAQEREELARLKEKYGDSDDGKATI